MVRTRVKQISVPGGTLDLWPPVRAGRSSGLQDGHQLSQYSPAAFQARWKQFIKGFVSFLRSFCHLLTLAIVGEIPSFSLLVMLVVVVLSTYPLSMVAVEMVPSIYNNSFLLVMLKYVVGTTHHLIVPLGILAVRTDLR